MIGLTNLGSVMDFSYGLWDRYGGAENNTGRPNCGFAKNGDRPMYIANTWARSGQPRGWLRNSSCPWTFIERLHDFIASADPPGHQSRLNINRDSCFMMFYDHHIYTISTSRMKNEHMISPVMQFVAAILQS